MKLGQRPLRLLADLSFIVTLLAAMLLLLAPRPAAAQFTEIDPGLAKPPFPCVVWGDYDGDGDLDVLVAGLGKQDIAFSKLYNNSGGTFTDSGIVLLGLSRASAAWGDFDGDGDLDLAMTGLTTEGIPTTLVYRNDGGTFTPVAGPFTGVFAGSVAWGDFDGDGKLDLLVTGVSDGGALVAGLWRNDGGGNFTDAGANLPGMDIGVVAWGDYDNDGDLDLLFAGNSNEGWITRLYRNDGGTFTNANAGLLGLIWSSAAWGDYDNDGDLDLMIIGYDPVAQVHRSILYRNDAGAFVDSGATFHNLILGTVSWVDYDNDGRLDLSLAGNENGLDLLSLYRNTTATPNTVPSAPTNLLVNVLGTSVDLSWSAASDAQPPAAARSSNLRIGTSPSGSQLNAPQSSAGRHRRL